MRPYKQLLGWPKQLPPRPEFAKAMSEDALPTISVVCPSYQQGRYIEQMILSVIYQNYPKVQLVIFDGGSTDETVNVFKAYQDEISHWVSKQDRGQSDALNQGFQFASGDVVGWQNADDLYLPNAFWNVARAAHDTERPKDSVYFGHVQIIDNEVLVGTKYFTNFSLRQLVYRGINFSTQSLFIGSNVCRKFAIDESLNYAMDGEYVLRLSKAGVPLHLVNQCLGAYRRHPDAKTIAFSEKSRAEWVSVLEQNGYPADVSKVHKALLFTERLWGLTKQGVLLRAVGGKYFG
ncbi:glycosyltransferase [Stieleria sp. JC731]|uniref:glycosyltransferase family 2 protein n=1 Tax=Pirellulaceae TaxID=2691357 RepID=UPI001E4C7AFC|nr:glycosyltransferase family 2 protein [Stieleria sp. JC731]MCC9601111.1 glycosyltransferase [Stieleria sp. JC731]